MKGIMVGNMVVTRSVRSRERKRAREGEWGDGLIAGTLLSMFCTGVF